MPFPGFVTDEQIQSLVEGELRVNAGDLVVTVPAWGAIITQANAEAYSEIQATFLQRGFTSTQIDLWDYGTVYQTKLAVHKAISAGIGLHDDASKWLAANKLKEGFLDEALLVVGGAIS